jgi:hypothetical protein
VNSTTLALGCQELGLRQIIKVAETCPIGTKRDFNGSCSQTTFIGSTSGGSCEKGFIRKPDGKCVRWTG